MHNINFIRDEILAQDYQGIFDKMCSIADKVASKELQETIWFLQHKDVYTIGRSGNASDIIDNDIPLVYTNRGGMITYHGVGQLICYLMLDIRKQFNSDVHKYVHFLEESIIIVLRSYGILAHKSDKGIGVWIEEEKIASIGVRISKGVSIHGFALNVNPDLSKFNKIVPCGIQGCKLTSMKKLQIHPNISDISQSFIDLAFSRLK